jgi:hypothetical protein
MIVSIMQPTYIPWTGYFNLIDNSDIFVFLDDVQFEKQSWQQRNRIILNKMEYMLTLPVLTKHKSNQNILDVELDEKTKWRSKHLKTMELAYKKHQFGSAVIDIYKESFIINNNTNLSRLNICFIVNIIKLLHIDTKIIFSSEMNIPGKRSDKIYAICKKLNATAYLSPAGSKQYIDEEGIFARNELQVIYQNYNPIPYPQKDIIEFIPYMSIVDLLANVGFEAALFYIESGYKYIPPSPQYL